MTKLQDGGTASGDQEVEVFRLIIGGKPTDALSGKTFDSVNPYTGRVWAKAADAGPEDVDAAVAAARAAFDGEWGSLTGFERAALMRRLGDLVAENAERPARLEVNDSRKLYREMVGQMKAMSGWYYYHAGLPDKIEGRSIPTPNPDYLVYTTRVPIDVVAAITPWNSPLLLLTWKLAPALAAGCTMVVKPFEHSPISTVVFASLLTEAGFPAGVLNVITSERGEVGATGQTCMAGSRLIVHEDVYDELVRLVSERASTLRLGDPQDPATEMGPVANKPQYDKVLGYLRTAVKEGAHVVCGGGPDALGGYFVRPTVLTGVGPDSTVVREEIFGTVASAVRTASPRWMSTLRTARSGSSSAAGPATRS